jgi:hypothetical protein
MKEYETFDKYLSDSKQIQAFIDNRLGLMFEVFKISTLDEAGKSHWIEKIGSEFELVLELIEKIESQRGSLSVR